MDSSTLSRLNRVSDFSAINAELDLKASILMKEVEDMMRQHQESRATDAKLQMEDLVAASINELDIDATPDTERPVPRSYDKNNKSVEKSATVTWKGTNLEPELRFLKAKLKILSSELKQQQSDHHQKIAEWRAREGEMRGIKEERERAAQQVATMTQQLQRVTTALGEQTQRVSRLEADNSRLTSELQSAKKEVKNSVQRAATLELRLNRQIEEGESLRASLFNCKAQDKEEKEELRRKLERQAAGLQRGERQRNELTQAFRRQMLLCHNLQQQKEMLIAGAALYSAENHFDQLLASRNAQKEKASN